jgi:hypothetical protein
MHLDVINLFLVMTLQIKMKAVESAVRQVSSTANDTINESINQSLQHNQTSNPDSEEINNDQKQNSSSLKFSGTKYSKWTLSSYETSTHMKPIEIKCKVGSILKNDLCGKILYYRLYGRKLSQNIQISMVYFLEL